MRKGVWFVWWVAIGADGIAREVPEGEVTHVSTRLYREAGSAQPYPEPGARRMAG